MISLVHSVRKTHKVLWRLNGCTVWRRRRRYSTAAAMMHSILITLRKSWFWIQEMSAESTGIVLPKLFWPTVRKFCSSVILNFSRVMRSRKVSRGKVLQIQGRRPRICNVFEIHFSWPQYPGKFQNYTRTNYSNSERSGQLW